MPLRGTAEQHGGVAYADDRLAERVRRGGRFADCAQAEALRVSA